MKWLKYATLVASNPIVAVCLDDLVGPPCLTHGGTHPKFTKQQWVEQQLEYVAIRPWDRLDMSATDVSAVCASSIYSLHYHIGGQERICSRKRWLNDEERRPVTIAEALQGIVDWYGRYWALQPNRPLIFDAVARKSSHWPDPRAYASETVSIWLPPAGFQP